MIPPTSASEPRPQTWPPREPTGWRAAAAGSWPARLAAHRQVQYVDLAGSGIAHLADRRRRAVARVLDIAIINAATAICYFAFALIGAQIGSGQGDGQVESALFRQAGRIGGFILAFIIVNSLLVVYEYLMLALWGATIGKMLMGIRVVRTRDGRRPGFVNALLRCLIPWLCGYLPVIGSVGAIVCYLSAFADASGRRQGWHDKVAQTVVISREEMPPA